MSLTKEIAEQVKNPSLPGKSRDYWFSLPRRGKDFVIREYLHDTSEIADNVYKWDGMKHVFSHQTKRPDN